MINILNVKVFCFSWALLLIYKTEYIHVYIERKKKSNKLKLCDDNFNKQIQFVVDLKYLSGFRGCQKMEAVTLLPPRTRLQIRGRLSRRVLTRKRSSSASNRRMFS